MHDDAIDEAGALLARHWQAGTHIEVFPAELRPASRAEGYAVQARLASGAELAGWKIAATSAAGQAHIGATGPLAGRLLASRMLPDGGRVPLGSNNMRVAEIEFAFRMARRLPPAPHGYAVNEVLEAVGSLHPAIEVPGSRHADFASVGEALLIADNACADWVVMGPPCGADWRSIDLARHEVFGSVTGAEPTRGVGSNALGDPRVALAWLVNELSHLGIALEAGQVVITGTCLVPMPVAPGVQVRGDLGVLGQVTAMIG